MSGANRYEERFYRGWPGSSELQRYEIAVGESDLLILSETAVNDHAVDALHQVRGEIERHIEAHPDFKTSLKPLTASRDASKTVLGMIRAGQMWNVGPMAAVAGAVAQAVGLALREITRTVIVENGGDIYARSHKPVTFALYAGEESPFADKLAFELSAADGIGVCTSSGKVGPSLSFGNADAVVAIHRDTTIADAAATAIANRIQSPEDVARIIEEEKKRGVLDGLIACAGDKLGLFGDFEFKKR